MALLFASACGGGGGGGGDDPTPSPSLRATNTPVPTAELTATSVPTATQTSTPTSSVVVIATATFVPTTAVPATATAVPTETPEPTIAFTSTPEPSPTDIPPDTATPTEQPTLSPTPTETPLTGPVITAFGLAETTGTFNSPVGRDAEDRPIFRRPEGSGFIIFVETRTGVSGLPIATNLLSTLRDDPGGQPDLQIVASRSLGDGSAAVCDRDFPSAGGIPAVDPPEFGFIQPVSDALNDFACRFRAFTEPDFACTQNNNNDLTFANSGSVLQFCTLVNEAFPFPAGETVLTVRVRDTAGRAGPPAQIVVRVGSS